MLDVDHAHLVRARVRARNRARVIDHAHLLRVRVWARFRGRVSSTQTTPTCTKSAAVYMVIPAESKSMGAPSRGCMYSVPKALRQLGFR